ncbi:winged helix-turn-helix domain-containing protein [Mesorhizobium sp. WSM3224]|uniref:winged helix-turn-helix domain-containing protein n=1 Tax=Mesorhizobium sp. WSM3224 TaxID=1040986 RepID=UPI0004853412|nr:winged helix-turn-helix domain-containing protein [Mesorhizobium sp. WSM3224]
MCEACKTGSVLVVDDVLALMQTMEEYVRCRNLSINAADAHAEGLKSDHKPKSGAVIAKSDFGKDDGPEFWRDLRKRGDFSIVVIGNRRSESDKVIPLESDADEALSRMRGLMARIHSLVGSDSSDPLENQRRTQPGKWLFGGWELRSKTRQLRDPSGALVPLTQGEYALLVAFLEAAEQPVSREYLQRATRIHGEILDRSIDVQILRLRRKLEADASAPKLIKTKRGIGYVFNIPAERA